MATLARWLRAAIRRVQDLQEPPNHDGPGEVEAEYEPDLQLYHDAAAIVQDARKRALGEGLPAVAEALRCRSGPIGFELAATLLAEALSKLTPEDKLSVAEAAKILNVSPHTIYDLCSSGRLRHQRLGSGRGTIRIKRADLDSVAKTKDVKPTLALFEAHRRRQK